MSALQLPRQMIFLPELAPHFVLAVQDTFGWSIRDYSTGKPELRFARDIGRPIEEFIEKARLGPCGLVVDAPSVSLTNSVFWKKLTDELGKRLLQQPASSFVSLQGQDLLRIAASADASERSHLLAGPSSPDWITWNAMRLLELAYPNGSWWARIATHVPPTQSWPVFDAPHVRFWHKAYPSPLYKGSEDEARVDLTFDSRDFLIYIESKIKKDIPLRTTSDKRRNRIVRLADCLLREAAGRPCAIWIFARDLDPRRDYVHLVHQYNQSPEMFAAELPHLPADQLYALARRLTVLRWRDLLGSALDRRPSDDATTAEVRKQLRRKLTEAKPASAAATRAASQ